MKFVILGSGYGSNAEALLKSWKKRELGDAVPVGILSDRVESRILTLGEEYGVPSRYINPGLRKARLSRESEQDYITTIKEFEADLVVLAGFMRIIDASFLEAFPGRVINLHPSLLPSFKGLDAIGQAYRYGAKYTGCTVHYVTGEVDGGPIIDQEVVHIENKDTLESLEAKVHAAEHKLLPRVVADLSLELVK